jgi:hypothetical protein
VTANVIVPLQPGARMSPVAPILAAKAYDPAVFPVNVVPVVVSAAGALRPVVTFAVAPVEVVYVAPQVLTPVFPFSEMVKPLTKYPPSYAGYVVGAVAGHALAGSALFVYAIAYLIMHPGTAAPPVQVVGSSVCVLLSASGPPMTISSCVVFETDGEFADVAVTTESYVVNAVAAELG